MPGEPEGAVIDLVWPDGNDDGEIFVRGHVWHVDARLTVLKDCDELERLAEDSLGFRKPGDATSEQIEAECRRLVDNARVEHGYARWSREALAEREDLNGVLRYYSAPGPGGRFPVTRLTLWPRPVCHLSVNPTTGIYRCTKCARRFRGPVDPYVHGAPADCPRLVGDERTQFVEVYEELESGELQA